VIFQFKERLIDTLPSWNLGRYSRIRPVGAIA